MTVDVTKMDTMYFSCAECNLQNDNSLWVFKAYNNQNNLTKPLWGNFRRRELFRGRSFNGHFGNSIPSTNSTANAEENTLLSLESSSGLDILKCLQSVSHDPASNITGPIFVVGTVDMTFLDGLAI